MSKRVPLTREKIQKPRPWVAFALGLLFYSCLFSVDDTSFGASDEVKKIMEQQKQMDERLASELQGLITCASFSVLSEGNLYCNLKFRGLDMDFAGANAPGGGTIYVNSLGKNQTLSAKGRRCIEIEFKDKDLRVKDFPLGATILFKDDATVTYNLDNKKAWKECG